MARVKFEKSEYDRRGDLIGVFNEPFDGGKVVIAYRDTFIRLTKADVAALTTALNHGVATLDADVEKMKSENAKFIAELKAKTEKVVD